MNERIRELKEQAFNFVAKQNMCKKEYFWENIRHNPELQDSVDAKFAELLIAKCLSATDNVQEMFFNAGLVAKDPTETLRYREAEAACFMVKNKIKLMFGIEE